MVKTSHEQTQESMTKRHLPALLIVIAGFGILPACTPNQSETESSPPNIIFILADDLGWFQPGCYGSKFYETPVLDQMAAEGMLFTNAYAAAPVCSPTRGSIMTGQSPARTHLTVNIPTGRDLDRPVLTPEFAEWLPVEEITIAETLQSAGYTTGHFGKWHLNRDKDYAPGRAGDPGSQGFDVVLTTQVWQGSGQSLRKGLPARPADHRKHTRFHRIQPGPTLLCLCLPQQHPPARNRR
jgi:arylsulfatase A-like enzyme